MASLVKLMLSSILITVIVLGLSSPVAAQPPSPTIYVEAPDSVIVSTEFDIIISIRDIANGWGMTGLDIEVQWDPNDLEYIECEFLGSGRPGWSGDCGPNTGAGGNGQGDAWTEDAEWFRFRFHCLSAGPAPITVFSPGGQSIYLVLLIGGGSEGVTPQPVTVTVNQVEPAPVAGVVTATSKLTIIAPYLVLAGIVAVASAIYIKKRRHN